MSNENHDPYALLLEVAKELYSKRQLQETDPWPLLRMALDVLGSNLLYNDHGLMNKVYGALVAHENIEVQP